MRGGVFYHHLAGSSFALFCLREIELTGKFFRRAALQEKLIDRMDKAFHLCDLTTFYCMGKKNVKQVHSCIKIVACVNLYLHEYNLIK